MCLGHSCKSPWGVVCLSGAFQNILLVFRTKKGMHSKTPPMGVSHKIVSNMLRKKQHIFSFVFELECAGSYPRFPPPPPPPREQRQRRRRRARAQTGLCCEALTYQACVLLTDAFADNSCDLQGTECVVHVEREYCTYSTNILVT